jgi:hypothetical protein
MNNVQSWVPTKEMKVVSFKNDVIVFPFEQAGFPLTNPHFKNERQNYKKNFDQITHFINYFMNVYDVASHVIDTYNLHKIVVDSSLAPRLEYFVNNFYTDLFTQEVIDKIKQMVKDNLDHENVSNHVYYEAIKTEDLLIMSIATRLVLPMITHYDIMEHNGSGRNIYIYIKELFKRFGFNALNTELSLMCIDRVRTNYTDNRILWVQQNYPLTQIALNLFEKAIVTNALYKFDFDKNPLSFMEIIISQSLLFVTASKQPE